MLAAKLRRAMVDPVSVGAGRDRRSLPFRTKDPAGGGPGRSHDGKLRSKAKAGPIAPGRSHRLRCRQSQRLHRPNIAPASTAKTDGSGYAGVPVNQHDPHVTWPQSCLALDPSDEPPPWGLSAAGNMQTYLDEFVFRFNRRKRGTTFRSLFAIERHSLQHVGCAGTKCISGLRSWVIS